MSRVSNRGSWSSSAPPTMAVRADRGARCDGAGSTLQFHAYAAPSCLRIIPFPVCRVESAPAGSIQKRFFHVIRRGYSHPTASDVCPGAAMPLQKISAQGNAVFISPYFLQVRWSAIRSSQMACRMPILYNGKCESGVPLGWRGCRAAWWGRRGARRHTVWRTETSHLPVR